MAKYFLAESPILSPNMMTLLQLYPDIATRAKFLFVIIFYFVIANRAKILFVVLYTKEGCQGGKCTFGDLTRFIFKSDFYPQQADSIG